MLFVGLKSSLPERLYLVSFAFCLASTFSKSPDSKKLELLKNPAEAFGAIRKGFALRSAKTSSLTFHLPIAEGSVSSTDLNSPERKYPITELPFVPSASLFFNIGPDNANPKRL